MNHFNWLVDEVEHVYYTWQRAEEGRPAAEDAARRSGSSRRTHDERRGRRGSSRSSHIALPGEGVWKPTGPRSTASRRSWSRRSAPSATTRGSSPTSPGSTTRAPQLALYPGRYEPPSATPRGPMEVPHGQRWRLLATFNSGFIYRDGHERLRAQRTRERAAQARARHARRLQERPRQRRRLARRPDARAARSPGRGRTCR